MPVKKVNLKSKQDTNASRIGKRGRFKKIGDIYQLDDVDKKLLNLVHRYPNEPHINIAKHVGITPAVMSFRINKPVFIAALEELSTSHTGLLAKALSQALRTAIGFMNSSDFKLKEIGMNAMLPLLKNETKHIQNVFVEGAAANAREKMYKTTIEADGAIMGRVMDYELGQPEIEVQHETLEAEHEIQVIVGKCEDSERASGESNSREDSQKPTPL